jgi:hypothetical protein
MMSLTTLTRRVENLCAADCFGNSRRSGCWPRHSADRSLVTSATIFRITPLPDE